MDLSQPPTHPAPKSEDLVPHLGQVDAYLAEVEDFLADATKYKAPSEANRAWKLERIRRLREYVEDSARAIQAALKRRAAQQAPQNPAEPAKPSDAPTPAAKPKSLF
ncbi:MAG: hypothetical protein AMXMBFR7_33170 [Planctomycetota bacterium]